jgi:hypothetical protein
MPSFRGSKLRLQELHVVLVDKLDESNYLRARLSEGSMGQRMNLRAYFPSLINETGMGLLELGYTPRIL